MKKALALLLSLCLLLTLCSCGDRYEREQRRTQKELYNGKIQPELPEPLALDDGTTLDEQVLWDEGGAVVTLLGMYETSSEYHLALSVRNDSGHDLRIGTSGEGSVNGFDIYPNYTGARQVRDKGMDVASICYYKSNLPLVLVPGEISAELYLEDPREGKTEYFTFTVRTSAGTGQTAAPLSDLPCWRNGALSLTLLRAEEDEYGWTLYLNMDNTSQRTVYLRHTDGDVRVNGKSLGGQYFSCSGVASAGRSDTLVLMLSRYMLNSAGIQPGTALKTVEIEMTMQVFDLGSEPEDITVQIVVPSES